MPSGVPMRSLLVSLLALVVAACGPSNGADKGGKGPGMGMPPPDVAAAEARLEQARRNAARFKPLYAEKAVSQKDYDDAVSAEQIGAADAKAARARLHEAQLNLGYTKVEAPVSGVASKAQRSEG